VRRSEVTLTWVGISHRGLATPNGWGSVVMASVDALRPVAIPSSTMMAMPPAGAIGARVRVY
jgi:hypothetical protein